MKQKKVTGILMLIICVVFVLDAVTTSGRFTRGFLIYGDNYGLLTEYGRLVHISKMQGQFWRLLTYSFLHAGIPHLLVNLTALYLTGSILEKKIGSPLFATVFLLSGIGASVVMMFLLYGAVGASGGIYGLVGCLFCSDSFHRNEKFAWPRLLLIIAYLILPNLSASTAVCGHLAGFAIGCCCGLLLRRKVPKKET